MKKLIFILLIFAVFTPISVMGLSEENTSEFYYVNVHMEKIYPTRLGYIVMYRKGINGLATVGIPNEWFTDAASKAEIIYLPRGPNWPSMTIFYHNGEFSHVRLYVHRSKAHQTWGNAPQSADVSRYFQDQDSFKLEFE